MLQRRRCSLWLLVWWWHPAIHVQPVVSRSKKTVDKQCTCPVSELYMFPDATTVEPPEVSVVTVCKTLSCPVTATKAVCELLSSSESATEAVY